MATFRRYIPGFVDCNQPVDQEFDDIIKFIETDEYLQRFQTIDGFSYWMRSQEMLLAIINGKQYVVGSVRPITHLDVLATWNPTNG